VTDLRRAEAGEVPCMDYSCSREHEIKLTGPTMASYHT
jgi:hypothetical protein